jgi:hypothetical protein
VVLAVADEGPLLLLGDETDVLPDVSFRLPLGKVLPLLVVDRRREGVRPALLGEAGEWVGGERFSFDWVLQMVLFHSLSIG